jgi:hypothetical protein
MGTLLLALAGMAAAGGIAMVGRQLCLAQIHLDVVRDQRRRDRSR